MKLILFIRPGLSEEDLNHADPNARVTVVCYGAVMIDDEDVPSQTFIDTAWHQGIQIAEYDYVQGNDDLALEDEVFEKGNAIVEEINNLIMARYN